MRISDWSSDVCAADLTLEMLALQTHIGWAWLVRVAALAGFILASLVMHPAQGAGSILMSLLGGVALTSLAWTGHGAMDQGSIGWVHLSADIVDRKSTRLNSSH